MMSFLRPTIRTEHPEVKLTRRTRTRGPQFLEQNFRQGTKLKEHNSTKKKKKKKEGGKKKKKKKGWLLVWGGGGGGGGGRGRGGVGGA